MNTVTYLYEDEHILVCVKPAGMATESRARGNAIGQADLVSTLRNHLVREQRKQGIRSNQPPYLALIHRLDQPVEGILVFGKNKEAAAHLSRQLQTHKIQKDYLAVTVAGDEVGKEHCLLDYLYHDKKTGEVNVVSRETPNAQKAELTYRVLANHREDNRRLLRIHLITGRFHQIRVQLAHAGMPIVGDWRHGEQLEMEGQLEKAYNVSTMQQEDMPKSAAGIALCAFRLTFMHPITNRKMQYEIIPSHPAFASFLQDLQQEKEENGY